MFSRAFFLIAFAFFSTVAPAETVSDVVLPEGNLLEVSLSMNSYTRFYKPHLGLGIWKPMHQPVYLRTTGTIFQEQKALNLHTGAIFYEQSAQFAGLKMFAGLTLGYSKFEGGYNLSSSVTSGGRFSGKNESWHLGPEVGFLFGKYLSASTGMLYNDVRQTGDLQGLPWSSSGKDFSLVFSLSAGFLF